MLMDAENLLSDSQNLAQAAGSYVSTNTIDTGPTSSPAEGIQARGAPTRDFGRSRAGDLLVQVDQTFTSGGAATLLVDVIMSDNADLSSPTVLNSTPAIALATLVAGYQFRVGLPVGITKRYLGLRYTIGTAAMTAGTVTAGIVLDRQTSTI
jgi:hypothetical protein